MFTLTRNDNSASLALPQDMRWTDEFDWSATAQTAPVYTLSGAVVIQQGQNRRDDRLRWQANGHGWIWALSARCAIGVMCPNW